MEKRLATDEMIGVRIPVKPQISQVVREARRWSAKPFTQVRILYLTLWL